MCGRSCGMFSARCGCQQDTNTMGLLFPAYMEALACQMARQPFSDGRDWWLCAHQAWCCGSSKPHVHISDLEGRHQATMRARTKHCHVRPGSAQAAPKAPVKRASERACVRACVRASVACTLLLSVCCRFLFPPTGPDLDLGRHLFTGEGSRTARVSTRRLCLHPHLHTRHTELRPLLCQIGDWRLAIRDRASLSVSFCLSVCLTA